MEEEIHELGWGRETVFPTLYPVSWCGEHAGAIGIYGADPERVFRCGECGFATRRWERLEGHFYREHLGVRCG